MAGENGNGVDVWVGQNFVIIGGGIGEAKLFGRMSGMQAARRGDANQFNSLHFP